MPVAITSGVRVQVDVRYVPEHSDPLVDRYVFAYRIAISNESEDTVQLMRRHWYISEATGDVREVEGPGVIGERPIIDPGERHAYVSRAVIETPNGAMRGTYEMHRPDGSVFHAEIPEFVLEMPRVLH